VVEEAAVRFVLVHGGFHGAWCWELLVGELGRRGHGTVAVDLPGSGTRVEEEATLGGYRDAVVEVIEPGDVLVGHSLGGFAMTVAADAAVDRVAHVIYLAAGLPFEGQAMMSPELRSQIFYDNPDMEALDDGRYMLRSAERASAFFYHDCAPELAQWAWSRLTPQSMVPCTESISIPRFWEADLPRSYIRCAQDRASPQASGDSTLARLGVEPLFIDTSHSPFLSQPALCADLIVEATTRKPIGPLRPR
jgi:pimeloyl-ACP methyl ester carboxylesterase